MTDKLNEWGLPTEITCTYHGMAFGLYGIEYAYSLDRDVPMLTGTWCSGSGGRRGTSDGRKPEPLTAICMVRLIYDRHGGAHIGGHPCPQVDAVNMNSIPFIDRFLQERGGELQDLLADSWQYYY